jgi:hypothetical protein
MSRDSRSVLSHIDPYTWLSRVGKLSFSLVLQLSSSQRKHVLSAFQESLPGDVVRASLSLVETLKSVLLGSFAITSMWLEETRIAEKPD